MKIRRYVCLLCAGGIALLSLLVAGCGDNTPESVKPAKPELPAQAKEQIVQQLNSLTWILSQVRYHNDILAVREAERMLTSDALNFSALREPRMVQVVNNIRDFIKDVEIDEGNRNLADAVFEHEAAQCLWDSFSNISCGNAATPWSAVVNLTTSAAGGYMQYRKALKQKQLEHRKAVWELDKEMIRELNNLESDLNTCISDLTNRYQFPDGWRIGSNDAEGLANRLKWEDKNKALREISAKDIEAKFKFFPQYWLHRGVLEFAVYRESADPTYLAMAETSLNRYMGEYKNIHRYSEDAVLAASTMLGVKGEKFLQKWRLVDGVPSWTTCPEGMKDMETLKEEVLSLIQTISDNTPLNKLENYWKNYYIVYAAYDMIGEGAIAEQKLHELIDRLDQSAKQYKTDGRSGIPICNEPLNACLTDLNLRIAAGKPVDVERFMNILNEQYVATRKKLELFGKMSDAAMVEYLKKELECVELKMDSKVFFEDELTLQLPLSWFIYCEPTINVYGYNGQNGKFGPLWLNKDNEYVIGQRKKDENTLMLTFETSEWEPCYKDGFIEIRFYYTASDQPICLWFKNDPKPYQIGIGKGPGYTPEKPQYKKLLKLKW